MSDIKNSAEIVLTKRTKCGILHRHPKNGCRKNTKHIYNRRSIITSILPRAREKQRRHIAQAENLSRALARACVHEFVKSNQLTPRRRRARGSVWRRKRKGKKKKRTSYREYEEDA